MRKFTALLLGIMCVALAGCSGDSGNSPSDNVGIEPPPVSAEGTSAPVTLSTRAETSETAQDKPVLAEESSRAEESAPAQTSEPEKVRQDVTGQIAAYDNAYLGLPSADKVYIFSDAQKTAEIDGYVCGAVSCYDEHEGTLYYMCDFYISEDGGRVYRYYESEERFALLPEERITRLDPTRQSPDDIFAAANALYSLFHPSTNSDLGAGGVDYGAPVEINGETYYPVANEAFNTKEKLLDALDRYFSGEIVTALMDTNKFIERDDALYVRDLLGAGSNPALISVEYELTELNEDTAVFTEYDTYQYEAGESEVLEVVYTAKKQNGIWRFTDFTAPWTIH